MESESPGFKSWSPCSAVKTLCHRKTLSKLFLILLCQGLRLGLKGRRVWPQGWEFSKCGQGFLLCPQGLPLNLSAGVLDFLNIPHPQVTGNSLFGGNECHLPYILCPQRAGTSPLCSCILGNITLWELEKSA